MDPGMGSAGDIPPQSVPPADERSLRDHDRGDRGGPESSNGDSRPSGYGYREKQVKPNKVYIGGLPEHTRREDLQSCFGKIGTIVDIELKVGFGFVEFDSREAAEESVAKYHEGYFMGNKIKVELSHGGGRFSKFNSDPGACFKCGQMGHWARECPNSSVQSDSHRPSSDTYYSKKGQNRDYREGGSSYREQPTRQYMPPPPRDTRYGGGSYDYYPSRRATSPSRDYRDYPNPPRRDVDEPRARGPPPPVPPAGYESRQSYYPPPFDERTSYVPRGYPSAPPSRDYDRYDRRAPPPSDRYPYPPAGGGGGRPRSPFTGPPDTRSRDDFSRPPRDFAPPAADYRGRPASPTRYGDYPPRNAGPGYRRRSQSPPARGGPSYDAYPASAAPYANAAPPVPQNGGPVRDYPPRGEPGYRRP